MTAFRGGLLAAILLFAADIAQAQELKVGNTYRGTVQLTKESGGIVLPLPKGEWQLVALEQMRNNTALTNLPVVVGAFVSLDLSKNKRLKSYIAFNFATDMFHGGWKVPDYCSAEDALHLVRTAAHRRREIRCWGIKAYGMGLSETSPQWFRDTRAWIEKNTSQMPGSIVAVSYYRASGPKSLTVHYNFNPQAVGQARTGWNSTQVEADEKKKKYIESLKNFGTRWEPRVETGFAGKQP